MANVGGGKDQEFDMIGLLLRSASYGEGNTGWWLPELDPWAEVDKPVEAKAEGV